ncbi:hypothetical protein AMTRI_Chr10g8130 [Amborella trichopoda]
MHLYNAWLPPPVAELCSREKESFSSVVSSVKDSWRRDDPESPYATLKFVSIIDVFIKAKSEISLDDVKELLELGLELFLASQDKLYVQVRWGNILVRLLKKHGKNLSLQVQWRPFYEMLMHIHFTRNTGPEGWRLRQRHFETLTSLIRSCRKFFPSGSAAEIWSEFRAFMENPWHNSSFEGAGFIRLFLPTNLENQDHFSLQWIEDCLDLWASIPNCQFWDIQWANVIARCIKNCPTINWEPFLPVLFTHYLNLFEVPVANGSGYFPFPIDVPRNMRFLFSGRVVTPANAIAKSIVYLLKPGGQAQEYFEKLADLLEPYYHPSNGGRWTSTLERFLWYLVAIFQKRLLHEQQNEQDGISLADHFLGRSERTAFVKVVLQFIDRGQYSKNESLAETAAAASSILSYVEPTLVLPLIASRFHLALETMTATHQLKSAVTTVAFAGRALLMASGSSMPSPADVSRDDTSSDIYNEVLAAALSNALLGMDANDPPKTLATMQLIGSIFSSLAKIADNECGASFLPNIGFSEWLDEFLCRLFSLLRHLEPSSASNEGSHTSSSSGTFLVEDGPYYFCLLEILLGRLSKLLYQQALKKISNFVKTNILPGAVAEIGLLCCATVHSNPEEAVVHLIEPILLSVISSLRGTPVSGFGGSGAMDPSFSKKTTLSPALETSIDYHLKILSVAISDGGPVLLRYTDQLKEAILSAFNAPSWKVNRAGDHLLRSLLGSLALYYPLDQYKFFSSHSSVGMLEEWLSTKSSQIEDLPGPKWHVPTADEVKTANELLDLHFRSALDDLLAICQKKEYTDLGYCKERLKVILLRIESSLQGVLSCLPDFHPSSKNGSSGDVGYGQFFIAGATGATVGSSELRGRAADVIHLACKYLVEERSDDSILLMLLIHIMDALANFGSLEYDEWSNHRQAWKLDSSAITEPPSNFIVFSNAPGKRRPRWAVVDKSYMHNTWRSSQSSYHCFRVNGNISPSDHVVLLMEDLLSLSLHNYEAVRSLAGKSLLKILKRFPTLISKCIPTLTDGLCDPNKAEHVVLGSCSILGTRTILRHTTLDSKAFSSFLLGILASSHHESLKAQKAINELFIKYNIQFAGVSKNILRTLEEPSDGSGFAQLVAQISSMSLNTDSMHWRYNLMANRVLLLLTMTLRSGSDISSKIMAETAGHFLKNLKSPLPPSRMLAISALNILLRGSSYKLSDLEHESSVLSEGTLRTPIEGALIPVFTEDGFFNDAMNCLSHDHIIADNENASSRGNHRTYQGAADSSITRFYFEFAASWPRTPSWISFLGGNAFYSSFARIFKRLVQECGITVVEAIHDALEDLSSAKERTKQCVASEALAGVLHSDVLGLTQAWDSWISNLLRKVILQPSVDSMPEWAACVRYAVTGKGSQGKRVPLLRQKIFECLVEPLPLTVATTVVLKRYALLGAALLEVFAPKMPAGEVKFHECLLQEFLGCMSHSSAQVREAIGVTLSIVCSNMQLFTSFEPNHPSEMIEDSMDFPYGMVKWKENFITQAAKVAINIQNANQSGVTEYTVASTSENGSQNEELLEDVKWMETVFYFTVSSLKSGRSSVLLDVITGLLSPVLSLQDTIHKDLSNLAKACFELLKWSIFPQPHLQKAVALLICSANDLNWRIRFATLSYLQSFMYRHAFILPNVEKLQIWKKIEELLTDNQVEVREHATTVLAVLMKGGDHDLAKDFRDKAYADALSLFKKRNSRNSNSSGSLASTHGKVLALAASVLSVPYEIPSWLPDTITLLARFVGEPSPVKSTVTKTIAEFRRTHADTWSIQKDCFTEDQLEVLTDSSSSSSYFA